LEEKEEMVRKKRERALKGYRKNNGPTKEFECSRDGYNPPKGGCWKNTGAAEPHALGGGGGTGQPDEKGAVWRNRGTTCPD